MILEMQIEQVKKAQALGLTVRETGDDLGEGMQLMAKKDGSRGQQGEVQVTE